MKLSEKGHFAPPPPLPSAAQRVSEALASWDGVHARTHWLLGDETKIDGADFYVGERELGHIHLDGEAHIFHSSTLVEALVERGLSARFRWDRAVGVFAIDTADDVEQALWLFRLAYDRIAGARAADLVQLVRDAHSSPTSSNHDTSTALRT